nr:putative receptor-like protein kinase [Quercus suber]
MMAFAVAAMAVNAKYKLMLPTKLPILRSTCLTIPPGLNPMPFLESPVLLSNMKAASRRSLLPRTPLYNTSPSCPNTNLSMFENMGKSLTFSSLLFLVFFTNIFIDSATSSCPIDLSYVETFPWNTTMCREVRDPNGTHVSLFGIGIAQHLKDTSMFQLPDLASSSSCLSNLQNKLEALSIQPSLVPQCLGSATNFVANTSQCAGIITTQDWNQRVNGTTQLDSSCQGDMTVIRCGSCAYASMQVNFQLANFDPIAHKNASTSHSYILQELLVSLVQRMSGLLIAY